MNNELFSFILWAIICWVNNSTPVVQPWPLKVERTGFCCLQTGSDHTTPKSFNKSEVTNLHTCLRKQQALLVHSSDVSIVTFSSSGIGDYSISDIEEFSVYQRSLIAAYAETNRYVYKHINNDVNDVSFENATDVRWFKIKILLDALNGWAKHTDWIIWIDADAIVLDFNLDVRRLGRRHPEADLLASADIRMGLINTGVLLLRNTPWLRQFLHQWWYGPQGRTADDTISQLWRSVCDQDAFDRLYSLRARAWLQGEPRISDKVKILRMDAVNSHPPAMIHQRVENAVLHLMGESTALRRELFRRAWGAVCAARSGGVLPMQLGLQRDVLLSYARAIYTEQTQSWLSEIQNTSVSSAVERMFAADGILDLSEEARDSKLLAVLVEPLQELSRTAHHLCDILRHLHSVSSNKVYQSEALLLRNQIYESVVGRAEIVKIVVTNLTSTLADAHSALKVLDSESETNEAARIELMLSAANVVRKRHSLLSVYVQLLKRAAEAGNDLFGAEPFPVQKLRIAAAVLEILDDLESQVEDRSKHVPQHMRALMHQSLGILEQSVAHSSEMEAATNISRQDIASVHLREAHKHFLTSVTIFRTINNSSHPHVDDSSFLMEVSLSLQHLAGITCSLGWYEEGFRRWDAAIEQARASLRGIEVGIRLDNLAAVLYNAAVCHSAAGKRSRVELLLAEALNITSSSSDKDILFADELLSPSAMQLRDKILELRSKNSDTPLPSSDRDQTSSSHPTAHSPEEALGTVKSELGALRPVIDPISGKVSYIRKTLPSSVTTPEVKAEVEEWVECELDELCEEFEVEVGGYDDHNVYSESVQTNTVHTMPGGTETGSDAVVAEVALEELDVEGMTSEEVAELKEVRERYARQQKKQLERSAILLQFIEEDDSNGAHTPVPATDTLIELASQLDALRAAHDQQGRIIKQMIQKINTLRGL